MPATAALVVNYFNTANLYIPGPAPLGIDGQGNLYANNVFALNVPATGGTAGQALISQGISPPVWTPNLVVTPTAATALTSYGNNAAGSLWLFQNQAAGAGATANLQLSGSNGTLYLEANNGYQTVYGVSVLYLTSGGQLNFQAGGFNTYATLFSTGNLLVGGGSDAGAGYPLQLYASTNAMSAVRNLNNTTGASTAVKYQLVTATANSFWDVRLYDNSAAPYVQQVCGPAVVNNYYNGPNHLFQNQPGTSVWGALTGTTNGVGTDTTVTSGNLGVQSINNGQLAGKRRRNFNGDFRIAQYAGLTGIVNNSAAAVWPVDGWQLQGNVPSSTFISQQMNSDSPPGFTYCLNTYVNASHGTLAAGDYSILGAHVEGFDCEDFQMGVTAGIPWCISFWAKASTAGNYSISITNDSYGGSTWSYVTTVALTTSWAKFVIPMTSTTSGGSTVWNKTNVCGLRIWFNLGTGTNFSTATTGSWQNASYLNDTGSTQLCTLANASYLRVGGFQVELGPTATPYEWTSYPEELARCQRELAIYLGTGSLELVGLATSATTTLFWLPYPVEMRAVPTLSYFSLATFSLYNGALASGTPTAVASNIASTLGASFGATVAINTPTIAAAQGVIFYINAASGYLSFSAQL